MLDCILNALSVVSRMKTETYIFLCATDTKVIQAFPEIKNL